MSFEAAGHIAPEVWKKTEMNSTVIQFKTQAREWYHSYLIDMGLQISINLL